MSPATDIDLPRLLKRLHLPTIARLLPDIETRAAAEGWGIRDALAILCAEEVANRNNTRIQKAIRNARFPFLKTIEEFDFTFGTGLRRDLLAPYLCREFITEGRNLILSGKSGRGKTALVWIPIIIAGKFQILLRDAGGCQTRHFVQEAEQGSGEALGDQSPKPPGIYRMLPIRQGGTQRSSRAEIRPAAAVFGPWRGARVASPRCPTLQPGRQTGCGDSWNCQAAQWPGERWIPGILGHPVGARPNSSPSWFRVLQERPTSSI